MMTLPWAVEVGVALSSTLALLAVLAGGELPVAAWAALLAPAMSSWLKLRHWAAPPWVATVLGFAGLAAGIAVLLNRGISALLLAAGIAMLCMFVARLFARRTLRHDQQTMLLSLLLVLSGAGLNGGLSYGVVFVAYAIALTLALVTRQLLAGVEQQQDARGPDASAVLLARRDIVTPQFLAVVGGLAVAILVLTSVIFVLFPRVGMGSLALLAQRRAVLPTTVSLDGDTSTSTQVIARLRYISYENFARGLYLRAATYEELTMQGFQKGSQASSTPWARSPLARGLGPVEYELFMQPLGGPQLLTLGRVHAARVLAGGTGSPNRRTHIYWLGAAGVLRSPRVIGAPIRVWVQGEVALHATSMARRTPSSEAPPLPDKAMDKLLSIPAGLQGTIATLARQVVGDALTREAQAERIRQFLRREFRYTLNPPSGNAQDPLSAFLFGHRSGHCRFFATAQAALMRSLGIPSRVVGGFVGGRWNPDGKVVVFTAGDAHAWVEWYEPGLGWVQDDATPVHDRPPQWLEGFAAWSERLRSAWDDYVIEYGMAEQISALLQLRSVLNQFRRDGRASSAPFSLRRHWGVLIGLAVVAALGLFAWLRRTYRGRRRRRQHPLGAELEQTLVRLGIELAPSDTIRCGTESAAHVVSPDHMAVLEAATTAYEAERFGREKDLEAHHVARLVVGLRAIDIPKKHPET